MKPTTLALAAAGLCLLGACGPKGGNATAAGPAGATAAPGAQAQGGPDTVIDFSALPRPRAGLWQNVIDDGDGHPDTTTSCLSGKMPNIKLPKNCSQMSFKRTFLGAIVMDMDCGAPNGAYHFTAHTVATGDFQSSMVSDGTMTMQMQGRPPQVIKSHTEAKYLGPCAPGQKPEDEPDTSSGATG
ncbi:MAG TPA: DUF3617 family protein [Caulobacteraceae bacterium]|nr:DUF3617 family protein [Caulobacteraceae bacterium]